jgi:hypothetical protein
MRKEVAGTGSGVEAEARTASGVEAAAHTVSGAVVAFPTASAAVALRTASVAVAVAFHTAWAAVEFGWAVRLNLEGWRAEAASISAAGALAVPLASVAHLISVGDQRNHGSPEGPVFGVSIRLQRARTGLLVIDRR